MFFIWVHFSLKLFSIASHQVLWTISSSNIQSYLGSFVWVCDITEFQIGSQLSLKSPFLLWDRKIWLLVKTKRFFKIENRLTISLSIEGLQSTTKGLLWMNQLVSVFLEFWWWFFVCRSNVGIFDMQMHWMQVHPLQVHFVIFDFVAPASIFEWCSCIVLLAVPLFASFYFLFLFDFFLLFFFFFCMQLWNGYSSFDLDQCSFLHEELCNLIHWLPKD